MLTTAMPPERHDLTGIDDGEAEAAYFPEEGISSNPGSGSNPDIASNLEDEKLIPTFDAMIDQIQSTLKKLLENKSIHDGQDTVERRKLERELSSQGVNLRTQLEFILKPDRHCTLRPVCGDDRSRLNLMEDLVLRCLESCPHATVFHGIQEKLDSLKALLEFPRTRPHVATPVPPHDPKGWRASTTQPVVPSDPPARPAPDEKLQSPRHAMLDASVQTRSSEINAPTPPSSVLDGRPAYDSDEIAVDLIDGGDAEGEVENVEDQDAEAEAPLRTPSSGDGTPAAPLRPSAFLHRSQSLSQNRRRVSYKKGHWKTSWQVLHDLGNEIHKSQPVQLHAWDQKGVEFKTLKLAISYVKEYCPNHQLQWIWGDHPVVLNEVRRCCPWRWSPWKNPEITVAEMNAYATDGIDRPVRVVARTDKYFGSVTDAMSFLESMYVEYGQEPAPESGARWVECLNPRTSAVLRHPNLSTRAGAPGASTSSTVLDSGLGSMLLSGQTDSLVRQMQQ